MADLPTPAEHPVTAPAGQSAVKGRYCIIIPAFQAGKTIGPLVSRLKATGLPVVVIDDGSRDETAAVASQLGALVISHLRNQGKGQALRTGFDYAVRTGYDGVVTLDSDGQHDPAEIGPLIRAGEVQHAGLVLGNRMINGAAMPLLRRRTNRLMSSIVSWMAKQPIPDSQCGLRFIRKELLETIKLKATRYEIETELLVKAARRRWKIISIPIASIYHHDHKSHIRPVRDTFQFLGLLVRLATWR